jgi:hypothetical protein
MYFIASLLFKRVGNMQGAQECDRLIEQFITDCETDRVNSPEPIKGAVSVLNLMAFRLAPVTIPNSDSASGALSERGGDNSAINENAASESEQLRLRALSVMILFYSRPEVDAAFCLGGFGQTKTA